MPVLVFHFCTATIQMTGQGGQFLVQSGRGGGGGGGMGARK